MWYVYDGDCPLCRHAALALRVKKSLGALTILDARSNPTHPIILEIRENGYDLDTGTVMKIGKQFYHGTDALHMLALVGGTVGWINRLNAFVFKYRWAAKVSYPILRGMRNLLLRLRGVPKIRNLDFDPNMPLHQTIMPGDWSALPPVMKAHYSIRPFSADKVRMRGHLTIQMAWPLRIVCRLFKLLVPYNGDKVPTTVEFESDRFGSLWFKRTLYYPEYGPYQFQSHMAWVGGQDFIEHMRFGLGWNLRFVWTGTHMTLQHRGYSLTLFGYRIPVPLGLLLGKGHAEETPLSETDFKMWTHTKHPLFGETFRYAGQFHIESDP